MMDWGWGGQSAEKRGPKGNPYRGIMFHTSRPSGGRGRTLGYRPLWTRRVAGRRHPKQSLPRGIGYPLPRVIETHIRMLSNRSVM